MAGDPLDAELTSAEVADLAHHYPALVGEANGHQYSIYTRRELIALSARYPSNVTHLNRPPAPTGDAAKDEMRSRYPTMFAEPQ
jgi:hypothetical protein